VFKTVIDQYEHFRQNSEFLLIFCERFTRGEDDSLRNSIDQYLAAQTDLQQVLNPSGSVLTGGLAEPKFNIDGSAFTGSWGRYGFYFVWTYLSLTMTDRSAVCSTIFVVLKNPG
jgi:hypothetical protein